MDHKILNKMSNYLEGLGILTVETLKNRLQPVAVTTQPATSVAPKPSYIQQTFSIPVPRRTLAEAIRAGKYDGVNSDINEKNFPTDDTCFGDNKDMALFHFNKGISSENVVEEMDTEGYRPAVLMDLLALGEKYPDLQKKFPIAAPGSSAVFDGRDVPELWLGFVAGPGRLLLLGWTGGWSSSCRFLAVRK